MWVGGQRHAPVALPPGKTRCLLYRRLGVWTGAENLAPTGMRSPYHPARSVSLYRLSYPGPRTFHIVVRCVLLFVSRCMIELCIRFLVRNLPYTAFTMSRKWRLVDHSEFGNKQYIFNEKYIRTNIYTYIIHTYIHIYVHTYIQTYTYIIHT
jgi:hypothetical protein